MARARQIAGQIYNPRDRANLRTGRGVRDRYLANFGADDYIVMDDAVSSVEAFTYSCTRGDLYVRDGNGDFEKFANGVVPRTDLGIAIDEAGQNFVRTMAPSVSGSLPTNWTQVAPTGGISWTFGITTIGGIDFLSVEFTGTASGNGGGTIRCEGTQQIAAVTGETWVNSWVLGVEAGVVDNFNVIQLRIREGTSAGAQVKNQDQASIKTSLPLAGAKPQQFSQIVTLDGGGTTAYMVGTVNFGWLTGAALTGVKLLLGAPVNEERSKASQPFAGTRGATSLTLRLPSIPAISRDLSLTFDNGSVQAITDVSAGDYLIDPAILTRPQVKVADWGSV
jgi:hypothetical protein